MNNAANRARVPRFFDMNGFATPSTRSRASSETSRASTPEVSHCSSPNPMSPPRSRATWPSLANAHNADATPPMMQSWMNQTLRHERIAVGIEAPRRRTGVMGLGLLDDFANRLPDFGRERVLHMFDAAGAYLGCRPKMATWGCNGDEGEKSGWSEVR